jgi:hypothetical protein
VVAAARPQEEVRDDMVVVRADLAEKPAAMVPTVPMANANMYRPSAAAGEL